MGEKVEFTWTIGNDGKLLVERVFRDAAEAAVQHAKQAAMKTAMTFGGGGSGGGSGSGGSGSAGGGGAGFFDLKILLEGILAEMGQCCHDINYNLRNID